MYASLVICHYKDYVTMPEMRVCMYAQCHALEYTTLVICMDCFKRGSLAAIDFR